MNWRCHRQMLTNSLLTSLIGWFITLDLDRTAIGQKVEVVSYFLVAESHPLIATGVYARKMLFLNGRRLLGYRA